MLHTRKQRLMQKNTISEGDPLHLRNSPTKLMSDIGYSKGYKYAHDFDNKVASMQCMPDNLKDIKYYFPTNEGFEKKAVERIKELKELKKQNE